MAYKVDFGWEGFKEFEELLDEMVEDFGQKDAKRMLTRAVKAAMEPVLTDAKMNAPRDTGALAASLWIEARKPTSKDKRSKYVDKTDAVIASVTTAPGWKLAKIGFYNAKNTRSNIKQIGVKSDMRAIAQEFGTANTPAQPYLRPALESNASTVLEMLGTELKLQLERYQAKAAKKAAKFSQG